MSSPHQTTTSTSEADPLVATEALTRALELGDTNFIPKPSPLPMRLAQRVLAACGLVVSLPVLALTFVPAKLSTRGSFFVKSRRVGYLGIPFDVVKLRVTRADDAGNEQVTGFGRLLGAMKLDSIPLLWNILLGEMQFVGPRPLPPTVADELAQDNPGFERRYLVAPGLSTSPGVSADTLADGTPEGVAWLAADQRYLDRKSVGHDVLVMGLQAVYLGRAVIGGFFSTLFGAPAASEPRVATPDAPEDWSLDTKIKGSIKRGHWFWRISQRFLAAGMLVMLSPLFAALFVGVKVTSPGPFLFKQKRRGLAGLPFTIYKIRTMSMGSEKRTALGVQNSDPAVTKLGRIMRALKFDELPQLWNIVKGDMEFAGPRPIPMALEDELRKHIPRFRQRHLVKPGLTNAAQVSVMDNELSDRLIHDWSLRAEAERHYVENKSFAYDTVLVVMTAIYIARKALRRTKDRQEVNKDGIKSTLVLGIPVSNLGYDGVIDHLATWIENDDKHRYACIAPVHSIVEGRLHADHRQSLLDADIVTADGMPIVWAKKLMGDAASTRVYGPTLMLKTLERAEKEGWKVGFYGGHPERLNVMREKLASKYPDLKVVFCESPPFRALSDEEDQDVVDRINGAAPDLLWIGLGCPKQERWMREHAERVNAIALGVGAAFDFHAGAVRQAPAFLQKVGMEWAFRLWCEPRRLFRRYATTNPIFLCLFGVQCFKRYVLRRGYQKS